MDVLFFLFFLFLFLILLPVTVTVTNRSLRVTHLEFGSLFCPLSLSLSCRVALPFREARLDPTAAFVQAFLDTDAGVTLVWCAEAVDTDIDVAVVFWEAETAGLDEAEGEVEYVYVYV